MELIHAFNYKSIGSYQDVFFLRRLRNKKLVSLIYF